MDDQPGRDCGRGAGAATARRCDTEVLPGRIRSMRPAHLHFCHHTDVIHA
jgi:hypothetical protein